MKFAKSVAAKLFVAVLAGTAMGAKAHADYYYPAQPPQQQQMPIPQQQTPPPQSSIDDANNRLQADQSALQQDQATLNATQNSLNSLTAGRDRQACRLNDLQRVVAAPPPPSAPSAPPVVNPLANPATINPPANDAAKTEVDRVHDDAVAKFEQTDQWKQSYSDFENARQQLQGPTDSVIENLNHSRQFQDLVSTARNAKMNADKLSSDTHADPTAVKQAQDAFAAADGRVQELEEKTLQADPTVVAGRHKVDAAQARLDQLRDGFERNLANDPNFAALVAKARQQPAPETQITVSPPPQSYAQSAPAVDPQFLQQEQAKLDQMNHDLAQLQQDNDRLTARVEDDQRALADAQRDYAAATSAASAYPPPQAADADAYAAAQGYGSPGYATPDYAPQAYAAPDYSYAYGYPSPAYVTPDYGYYGGVYVGIGGGYYGGRYFRGGYYSPRNYSYGYGYGRGYSYGSNRNYTNSGYRGSAFRDTRSFSTPRVHEDLVHSYSAPRTYARGFSEDARSSRHVEERHVDVPSRSSRSFDSRSIDSRSSESFSSHNSDRSDHSDHSSHNHSH